MNLSIMYLSIIIGPGQWILSSPARYLIYRKALIDKPWRAFIPFYSFTAYMDTIRSHKQSTVILLSPVYITIVYIITSAILSYDHAPFGFFIFARNELNLVMLLSVMLIIIYYILNVIWLARLYKLFGWPQVLVLMPFLAFDKHSWIIITAVQITILYIIGIGKSKYDKRNKQI